MHSNSIGYNIYNSKGACGDMKGKHISKYERSVEMFYYTYTSINCAIV